MTDMNILGRILDIFFPQKSSVKRIETMGAEEIKATITTAEKVQNVVALFKYRHPLARQIVWEIKYRGNEKIAGIIGKILCEKILSAVFEECLFRDKFFGPHKDILIMPIPISAKRLKQRGHSQTELIAKAVMKNIPEDLRESFSYCPDILVKIKETPSQTSLGSRSARLSNLSGAFGIKDSQSKDFGSKDYQPAEIVRGKNIILIDDVVTTGATIEEAAGTLLDAGAKSVRGFAIAH